MTTNDYNELVFSTALNCGLNPLQARIITAQAAHESGNYSSHVFVTDNNLFGMKMPSRRSRQFIARPSDIVMSSEGATPYAHYNNVSNSVQDLVIGWHGYNGTNWNAITSPAVYSSYLKSKGYYGADEDAYTTALNYFYSKLDWLKGNAGKVSLIGFLFVTAFILYFKKL